MLFKRIGEVKNNFINLTIGEVWKRFFVSFIAGNFISLFTKYLSQVVGFESWLEKTIFYLIYFWFAVWGLNWIERKFETNISSSPSIMLNTITKFCFSIKNNKEVFKPIIADWQDEYFEALFKKEIWKERWINVRYTYAFLAAMWQKSPIGDLIEFVSKLAK